MAYLYRRPQGRIEIREAHATPRGPRSRTLVSFRGPLLSEHLERAQSAARRPFDRDAIVKRARDLGVSVRQSRADTAARALCAGLRRGSPLDPRLASLLREQLAALPSDPLPEALADVAEWVGASERERGDALRDVLRLYDTIARSREPVRRRSAHAFPKFDSGTEQVAS